MHFFVMSQKPPMRDKHGNVMSQEEQDQFEIRRIKLPREDETIGVLDQRLGASRMRVRCMNGKTLICRVPGRLKRKLWVREGDILLIKPWSLGGDQKGDVIYKYRPSQVQWLKKNGKLKGLEAEEF